MTFESIFGFVLALVVCGCVALAWITYDLRASTRATVSELASSVKRQWDFVGKLRVATEKASAKLLELEAQSPVELGVRVVELSEAVERLRKTHQRFAGRVSQELNPPDEAITGGTQEQRDALRRMHASDIMPVGVRK